MSLLLGAGADAWLADNKGATPLHHAAWEGDAACMKKLLEHVEGLEGEMAAADR